MPGFVLDIVKWLLDSWPISILVRFVSEHITSTSETTVRRIAYSGFKEHGLLYMSIAIAAALGIQIAIHFLRKGRNPGSRRRGALRILLRIILNVFLFYVLFVAIIGISGAVRAGSAPHMRSESNSDVYNPDRQPVFSESPLNGKRILCIGSSITNGNFSKGCSWVDYLESMDGAICTKETVGGSTLTGLEDTSYVSRIKKYSEGYDFDIVIIQLSTNDALMNVEVGTISNGNVYDESTFDGALEFMLEFVRDSFDCPVLVYSSPKVGTSEEFISCYSTYVKETREICSKWGAVFLDMFNDEAFNNVSKEQYSKWMANSYHPMKKGYLEWWLPAFRTALYEIASDKF